jgi:hypothetical protein
MAPGRGNSDEAYVIGLCDEILGELATRQHHFDWLLGDPGRNGSRRKLPVDAYYSQLRMLVEYQERQHDEGIDHFDRPNVITVSGVHRGIQRRIYDARRAKEIPAHYLRYVVIRPDDLAASRRGRLLRDRPRDVESLRRLLLS